MRYGASLVCPPNFKFHHYFFQDETILANVIPFSHETLNPFSPFDPPFEVKMWTSMEKKTKMNKTKMFISINPIICNQSFYNLCVTNMQLYVVQNGQMS